MPKLAAQVDDVPFDFSAFITNLEAKKRDDREKEKKRRRKKEEEEGTLSRLVVLFSYCRKAEDYKKFYEQSRPPVLFADLVEKKDAYKSSYFLVRSGDELISSKKYA